MKKVSLEIWQKLGNLVTPFAAGMTYLIFLLVILLPFLPPVLTIPLIWLAGFALCTGILSAVINYQLASYHCADQNLYRSDIAMAAAYLGLILIIMLAP